MSDSIFLDKVANVEYFYNHISKEYYKLDIEKSNIEQITELHVIELLYNTYIKKIDNIEIFSKKQEEKYKNINNYNIPVNSYEKKNNITSVYSNYYKPIAMTMVTVGAIFGIAYIKSKV
jgi:hypothetical protein